MLLRVTLIITTLLILSCQKETEQKITPEVPDSLKADSTYFIYNGLDGIRVTCLGGFPKKSNLDISGYEDSNTMEINLFGDNSPEIWIAQHYKYHNYWSSSKKGKTIESVIEGSPNIGFHGKYGKVMDVADYYFVLSSISSKDTIWTDTTTPINRVEISYCASQFGVDDPSFCRSSLYSNSKWIDGQPYDFLCWSNADGPKPVAYLISLQFSQRNEFIVHYVKKLEFNIPDNSPCND